MRWPRHSGPRADYQWPQELCPCPISPPVTWPVLLTLLHTAQPSGPTPVPRLCIPFRAPPSCLLPPPGSLPSSLLLHTFITAWPSSREGQKAHHQPRNIKQPLPPTLSCLVGLLVFALSSLLSDSHLQALPAPHLFVC